ncbi:MAG: TauD/TfdA family dioxygenase [Burkholderiaceae bacterium]|nr:TauD/TfdA family dioxygenase [Burkholderiaceae bacterium]
MSMTFKPLHPTFIVEVGGIDLSKTPTDDQIAELRRALDQHVVLVFRDQDFEEDQQVAFSARFGPPERPWRHVRPELKNMVRGQAVSMIGNLDEKGEIVPPTDVRRLSQRGNMLWHTDSSYRLPPGLYTMLYGKEVPPQGGATEFCDVRAAYDALPEATKRRIENLRVEHNLNRTFKEADSPLLSPAEAQALPPVTQPLVRAHPVTGRKSLMLGSPASVVVGWSVEDSRALLDELLAHATQERFCYTHFWKLRELVMWDNRSSIHRGRPFEDSVHKRQLRRTTICDVASEAALA